MILLRKKMAIPWFQRSVSVLWFTYGAPMSVLMGFCGPHFPLAFQFVCSPGERGGRIRNERQVEGFSLLGCAAAGGREIQLEIGNL